MAKKGYTGHRMEHSLNRRHVRTSNKESHGHRGNTKVKSKFGECGKRAYAEGHKPGTKEFGAYMRECMSK